MIRAQPSTQPIGSNADEACIFVSVRKRRHGCCVDMGAILHTGFWHPRTRRSHSLSARCLFASLFSLFFSLSVLSIFASLICIISFSTFDIYLSPVPSCLRSSTQKAESLQRGHEDWGTPRVICHGRPISVLQQNVSTRTTPNVVTPVF